MKNLKKILAVVIAITMVIGSISSTAFAGLMEIGDEGNNLNVYYYNSSGTQIGSDYYGSTENFGAIFTNKPSGTVSVKISPMNNLTTEDIVETLEIPAGEDVTFDLDGKNVTTSIQLFNVTGTSNSAAKLTLVNTGDDASITVTANHTGNGTIEVGEYGELIIQGIKLTGASTTPLIYNAGTFVAKEADSAVPYVNGIIAGDGTFKMSAGYYSAEAGTYDAWLDTKMTGSGVGTNLEFQHIANSDSTYVSKIVEKTLVAEISGTQYYSVQSAIDAASSGDTVKLLTSVNEEGVMVDVGKDITFDTAGFTFNDETDEYGIINHGTLTITDSINTSTSRTGSINLVDNTGTLNVEGVVDIKNIFIYSVQTAINITGDIAGSNIGISWNNLQASTIATKDASLDVDLSSYIGTVFTETFDDYELVVDGNSIYLVYLSIDAVSMTLANELAMNYYCTIPEGMLEEMGKSIILEVTCAADPEGTQYITGRKAGAETVEKTDEIMNDTKTFEQYIFEFNGIDPTWMASDITARVYLGESVDDEFDQNDAYDTSVYSVAEYCNALYANIEATKSDYNANTNVNIPTDDITDYYTDMETLIADILMYGKTAQIYRGYNTNALATQVTYEYNEGARSVVNHSDDLEWITSHKSSYTPAANGSDNILVRYAKNTNLTNLAVNGDTIEIVGATCMFGKGGYIAPRFMISADEPDVKAGNVAVRITRYDSDGETVKFKRTVALSASNKWSGYYYVEIGGPDDVEFQFYPQDFGQKIKVEVLAATNAGAARTLQILNYSINSYCCNWISDTSDMNMSNFALATFKYGKSTQALCNDLKN